MSRPVTAEPRRPFYRRKRWLAAGLLWLAVAYPASLGPAVYCYGRGWIPGPASPAVEAFYAPLRLTARLSQRVGSALDSYVLWCAARAEADS